MKINITAELEDITPGELRHAAYLVQALLKYEDVKNVETINALFTIGVQVERAAMTIETLTLQLAATNANN